MEPQVYHEMAQHEANHWWFVGRRRILNAAIKNTLGTRRGAAVPRILEIGAGTGGNHDLLSHYGQTSFVEMEPLARDIIKERFPAADLHYGKLPDELPPFPDQTFDLICLFDVLEHVADDKTALARLIPLLAPSGHLILTVPAYQFLFSAHDKLNHHHRRYSRAGLEALLAGSGLRIKTISYINMVLLPLALVARGADKLFKKEKGSGTKTPAPWLNKILTSLFGAEALFVPRWRLPCGLSLLVIADKSSL